MTVDFRRFLFLFGLFLVKIWLLYALFLTNLPVPVTLKRFAAALLVFIFGMVYSSLFCLIFILTFFS